MIYRILKPQDGKPPMLAGKPINAWIERWWNWYYSIEEKEHPSYSSSSNYGIRNNDYNQGRTPRDWGENAEKRVWFLAGAYGTNSMLKSIIPATETEENWSILAPAYNMGVSKAEFPSLDSRELEKLLKDDVDGAKDLKVTLKSSEGIKDLSNELQRIETDWFDVSNIPEENILALDVDHINMKSDGYWIFLELAPGEHILQLYGKSDNYESDMTFNLTVRGPGKKKGTI